METLCIKYFLEFSGDLTNLCLLVSKLPIVETGVINVDFYI